MFVAGRVVRLRTKLARTQIQRSTGRVRSFENHTNLTFCPDSSHRIDMHPKYSEVRVSLGDLHTRSLTGQLAPSRPASGPWAACRLHAIASHRPPDPLRQAKAHAPAHADPPRTRVATSRVERSDRERVSGIGGGLGGRGIPKEDQNNKQTTLQSASRRKRPYSQKKS